MALVARRRSRRPAPAGCAPATELLTPGHLERVKGCAWCRWLILDESRNRSRRLCAMEDCGTVEKMRWYVARRAAARR